MQQRTMTVVAGVVVLALSGCRPRQGAPAGASAPPALPDAATLSAQAHKCSGTDVVQRALPGAAVAATGVYGLAVTVGTVAMARVTAPAFAAASGPAGLVRLTGTNDLSGMTAPLGLAATRRMTAREALRDHEVRTRRAIARYGTAATSPQAQKEAVLLDDPRGPAPERAPQPQ